MAEKNQYRPPTISGAGPGARGRVLVVKPKNTRAMIARLWRYLSANKLMMMAAFAFVVIHSSFTLIATYRIRPIINGITANVGADYIVNNLIFMVAVYFIAAVCGYLQSRIMLEIAQKALQNIRTDLFSALKRLPIKYFDNNNNGDIMSRFTNDVDAVSTMLSDTCVHLISGIVTLATTLVLMLYTNPLLSVITISISPLITVIIRSLTKRSRKLYREQLKSLGVLNGYVEENIAGQKVVKVFSHEEVAKEEFKRLNNEYRRKSFNTMFISGVMGPLMVSLGNFSYTITAAVGGFLCVLSGFDIGGFAIFLSYSKSFTRPVSDISMQMNTIYSALAGAERVFEIIDEKPEEYTPKADKTPELIRGDVKFYNLTFSYVSGVPILKNITLSVKRGQKIAFVGSTGAGKTTITNLLNRFYDIQSGAILIDGIDIKNMDKEFLRSNIAMVLQDTHLFTGTVIENIRYGRLDATDDEIVYAAKTANADRFIRQLKNGYDTELTGDGLNLSQGQRQLLNIARAAVSSAPILVLDEATSSVDTRTERHIEEALDRLMKNRTTFVIAHRLSTVRNADVIVVLEHGEIIEQGSHDELIAKKGRYYNLHVGSAKLG